jgi:K+-sensing histidine kinase KdpD
MTPSLLLVGGTNKRFIAVAIEAANLAFPGVSVSSVSSVEEAVARDAAPAPEILAIATADEAGVNQAAQAVDAGKLPRWAVVALGDFGPVTFAEVIPEAECTASGLARAFRGAVARNELHRERERLRGDLLSVGIRFVHDLRTPVGGIVASTEVLDVSLPERGKSEKSLTQPIFESANDLVRIIGQLALVSKATAKPDSRQPFNMGAPVGRALERLEMKVREKSATVKKPATWPDAFGDPAHAEAAWLGLIENALRHSGKSPRIELGWGQEGETTKYWVRDGGPGIPVEKQRSLFFPFHRLHEPSAARGLGLPIVGRLVHLLGGTCGYEPAEPSGSCFFFKLPR